MQNQMFYPVTDDVKQQTARHLYDQNEITVMDESMPSPGEIRSEETIVLPEIVSMPEYIRRHYAEEIIRTCREEINDAHLCVMYDGRYFRNVPGRTAADDGGELILTDGPAPGDWDAPPETQLEHLRRGHPPWGWIDHVDALPPHLGILC